MPTDTINVRVETMLGHKIVTPHGVAVVVERQPSEAERPLTRQPLIVTAAHTGGSPVRLRLIAWTWGPPEESSGLADSQVHQEVTEHNTSEFSVELKPGETRTLRYSKDGWQIVATPAPVE
jgi:hypothetical protein